jgi:hypothetical protein
MARRDRGTRINAADNSRAPARRNYRVESQFLPGTESKTLGALAPPWTGYVAIEYTDGDGNIWHRQDGEAPQERSTGQRKLTFHKPVALVPVADNTTD